MNKSQVERYFKILGALYPKYCRVILTGAAAGALYGSPRGTMDVDFAAQTRDWKRFVKAVEEASARTGIVAQYAEDIDRWSSITLMDYDKHAYLYRRVGFIDLCLMEPPYWAIGKLGRYLDSDIRDMVRVFKKTRTKWRDVAAVAGKALRKSPKSTACFLFRKQVEDFLKKCGPQIWGDDYDPAVAIVSFHKQAGIHHENKQQ